MPHAKKTSIKDKKGSRKKPASAAAKSNTSKLRSSAVKEKKKQLDKPKRTKKKNPEVATRRQRTIEKSADSQANSETIAAEEKARLIIVESHKLVNVGNYAEASLTLGDFPVIGANQKQMASYHLLSALAASRGNEKEKMNILTIQCKKDKNNPFLHCLLGLEFVRGNNIKNAKKCLIKAQKIDPDLNSVKKLGAWITCFEPNQRISREKLANFNRLMLVVFEHKKRREYNKALKACVQAANILPKANVDIAENALSILKKLKGKILQIGMIFAEACIDRLEIKDCLILENKFSKRGNPAVLDFLRKRIKNLK